MAKAPPRRPVGFGEPLLDLRAASSRNPQFSIGSLGGRWLLMCALANTGSAEARAAIDAAVQWPVADESLRVCAIFIAHAAADNDLIAKAAQTRLVFTDNEAAAACGLIDAQGDAKGRWLLFDPSLRLVGAWPLTQAAAAISALAATPAPDQHAGVAISAPALIVPRVFEPEFCRVLIAYYRERGGAPSGITVKNEAGMAEVKLNDSFKRRTDCNIEDAKLREAAMHRMFWRLNPEIEKAFMWKPTRLERYIVARYDATEGGFFRPHRDNTTPATAHRRFAVTINLNAEDYEGGDLRFPEFGSRTYRAPTGGAVVFSCSLLHEATPVTRGERYAFLPFLYDEAAAKVRAANNHLLDDSIAPYQGE